MKHDFNTLHLFWAIRNIPSSILNIQERMILLMLLNCAGAENRSWHGQASLAEMCSLSETSIKKYSKALVQKGFVIIHNPVTYGRSICNQYELVIDHIMAFARDQKGSRDDTFTDQKGSRGERKGSPRDSERGRGATTKNKIEERKKKGSSSGVGAPPSPPPAPERIGVPCPPEISARFDEIFNRRGRKQTAH